MIPDVRLGRRKCTGNLCPVQQRVEDGRRRAHGPDGRYKLKCRLDSTSFFCGVAIGVSYH